MDRVAWWVAVHGVIKRQTWLGMHAHALRIFSYSMQTLIYSMWNIVPWLGVEPGPSGTQSLRQDHQGHPCSSFLPSFSYWFLGFLYVLWICLLTNKYISSSILWLSFSLIMSFSEQNVLSLKQYSFFSSRFFFFLLCLRNICLSQCHEETFLCYILEFTFYS